MSIDDNKFIFFGCWNNINCDKENSINYRDIVLDKIKENEKDASFIIVAGDNWYTNKKVATENEYYYYTNVLSTGYKKLKEIDKETHIILGNHDEDSEDITKDITKDITNYDKIKNILNKENCMLNTQKYYIDELNNIDINTIVDYDTLKKTILTPTIEKLYILYQKTKIQSLPTNLKTRSLPTKLVTRSSPINFEKNKLILHESRKNPEYIKKNNFNLIFLNTNDNNSLLNNTEYKNYLKELTKIIKDIFNKNPIFVIGHIPLISIVKNKNKEGKKYTIKTEYDRQSHIFIELYNILNENNCIYLCADTHNFQIGTIGNLLSIVSGTGGADPDILDEQKYNEKIKINDKDYEYNCHLYNSYGYTSIEKIENKYKIIYNKIINASDDDNVHKQFIFNIEYNNKKWEINNIDLEKYKTKEICDNNDKTNIVLSKNKEIPCFKKIKKIKVKS